MPERDGERALLAERKRGLLNRLRDSSDKIASLERHLAAERRRRDLLLLKGTTAGFSTRELGTVAGISSPAVTYATRRARQALAPARERARLRRGAGHERGVRAVSGAA